MSQQTQKYPNYPPYDSQIQFYIDSTLRINPTGPSKLAKICPKCQYPIQLKICIKPCMHYLCYECYMYNKQECAYCSMVACEVVQLGDNTPVYSCDGECYKVFDGPEALTKHMDEHVKIKGKGQSNGKAI